MKQLRKTSTPAYKHHRYNHSEKGRARNRRYYNTPWGYAYRRERHEEEILSGESARWQRERYYQIQDEAGCHRGIGDFYPGYRIIKALQSAEVVDI